VVGVRSVVIAPIGRGAAAYLTMYRTLTTGHSDDESGTTKTRSTRAKRVEVRKMQYLDPHWLIVVGYVLVLVGYLAGR
jgi:hypothetical protein